MQSRVSRQLRYRSPIALGESLDDVVAELKKPGRIPGYDKSQRFQVAERLYGSNKERISAHAIPAAKLLEKDRPKENKYYPRAEVFRFFEWYQSLDRIALLKPEVK